MTPFQLAQRYIGIHEIAGTAQNHPLIQWWLSLCSWPLTSPDETPWCSAFVNGICWELRLPRSKSAAARSWLTVGTPVDVAVAVPGFDVCVFERPGAPGSGHVGFFAGLEGEVVQVLGGNQQDGVTVAAFKRSSLIGVRRLVA